MSCFFLMHNKFKSACLDTQQSITMIKRGSKNHLTKAQSSTLVRIILKYTLRVQVNTKHNLYKFINGLHPEDPQSNSGGFYRAQPLTPKIHTFTSDPGSLTVAAFLHKAFICLLNLLILC